MDNRTALPQISSLLQKSAITAEDVLAFRRAVFNDASVSRDEAESLFAVNDRLANPVPEWTEFFVEAMTDYLVRQARPEGYIDRDNADWLIHMIARDGAVHTTTELEVLVKSLEIARSAPDFLSAFALEQVHRAIMSGDGAYARGGMAEPGVINGADVAMLRRVLFAAGGDGTVSVTRAEAEVLFDLNDDTANAANDPSWGDLFVRANANHLMAFVHYRAPDRDTALAREKWLDSETRPGSMLGSMLRTMVRGDVSAIRDAYSRENAWSERNRAFETGAADAARVTENELDWLANRIGRDGTINANERALLEFLHRESPDIHDDIRPLFERAGIAA